MYKVVELFGISTSNQNVNWGEILEKQICPFTKKRCYKVRKSEPSISIGTCTVRYGSENVPVVICPNRLLQKRKVFMDCLHLLQLHQPGNDIHVVPEITVPGGSIDYVIASVKNGKVVDFVGVEFQTLDTTGTVWPQRQKFLKDKGFEVAEPDMSKSYGMNWKMTAKTILIQLHHKVDTFEHLNKHLVLIIQDSFFDYMKREFSFEGINNPALVGDSFQFHSYSVTETVEFSLSLKERLSTNSDGIAKCLGLNAEAKVELISILRAIELKLSDDTLLKI
ncbi:MAG TPA: NotI family restriction endonuclease [Williamwhitmania sp.]|nr:NotI family restriction endonuclease [Williamwhitmania sp.]